ncbi:hypothetical protein SLS64_002212 [Diaporthe eres]
MPWEPIGSSERDELASAITKVHTNLFTTPSLFVNVRFEDASSVHHYVGGKRVSQPSVPSILTSQAQISRQWSLPHGG